MGARSKEGAEMLNIPELIADRMQELGLTLMDVERSSGYAHSTVYAIRQGYHGGQFCTVEAILESMGLELVVRQKDDWQPVS